MSAMASEITRVTIVYSVAVQVQNKENIKVSRHWPLCGEITVQKISNAENVSI